MATEQLITKLVDGVVPSIQATVEQVDLQNALIVKNVGDSGSVVENASLVLGYDLDGNLETITKTVGGVVTVKTLTYTEGVLTNVSAWEEA